MFPYEARHRYIPVLNAFFSPAFGIGAAVQSITWLLTNVLNLDATIGESATNNSTSATYAREYDDTLGIVISSPAVPAGKEVTEGMRKSTDTDEGGSVAAPVFLNSVSKSDSTKLHPNKIIVLPSGKLQTVYLLYDYRANSEVVTVGDHRYIVGTDNHNYALTCTTGGTTHTAAPAVAKTDIGSTVTETSGVVWSVDSHYSNIATETDNHLPHVLSEDVAVNTVFPSRDLTDTQYIVADGATKDNATSFTFPGVTTGPTANDCENLAAGNLTVTAAIPYVFSIYFSAADVGKTLRFIVYDGGWAFVGSPVDIPIGGKVSFSYTPTNTIIHMGVAVEEAPAGSSTFTLANNGGAQVEQSGASTSYIPTTTGSVQRNATSMTVTPDTADFLRMRFADVLSQTYLSSGTVAVSYDGTTLTVTDGTNAMTHTVAMAVGDWITIKESTGELYYRENLVSTNASYSPTWGEIELGNAVDYRFDDDLDPTDTTWSTP